MPPLYMDKLGNNNSGRKKQEQQKQKHLFRVSISADGRQNMLATLLIEDSYFVLERRSN